jgi:hypothetical protein
MTVYTPMVPSRARITAFLNEDGDEGKGNDRRGNEGTNHSTIFLFFFFLKTFSPIRDARKNDRLHPNGPQKPCKNNCISE